MKVSTATVLALCYFFTDAQGQSDGDCLQVGVNETCLRNHGLNLNKTKKLYDAVDYYHKSYIYLAGYDTYKMLVIHDCIPIAYDSKNGDEFFSTDTEAECLKNVIPGKLEEAQDMVLDIQAEFMKAADGNETLYRNIWPCLRSALPPMKKYMDFSKEAVDCASDFLSEFEVMELDMAFHHFKLDWNYIYSGFGMDRMHKAYSLCDIELKKLCDRMTDLQRKDLLDPSEIRCGYRMLPGGFDYFMGVVLRFSEVIRELTIGKGEIAKERAKEAKYQEKARALVACMWKK